MSGFYEDSYERLSPRQTEQYLARIGINRPPELSVSGLNALLLAHQTSVPFENIDIYDYGLDIPLDAQSLFDKVVSRGRGGYCFELNALFMALLRGLGFDARPASCRVTAGDDFPKMQRHRATLVSIDGTEYFCDVGFGGSMSPLALPVRDGARVSFGGESFAVEMLDGYWAHIAVDSPYLAKARRELTVGLYTCAPVDFVLANDYCSKNPEAAFVRRRRVHMRRGEGYVSLTDGVLEYMSGGKVRSERLPSPEALRETLTGVFGIKLDGSIPLTFSAPSI